MAETAIIDIELDFLNRLKQADQSLASMINNANKLTDSLKKAFNSVDGTNIDLISRMAAQWEALGSQKLRLNVDTSKIEELTSLLDNTVQVMQAFSSSGIELFDTDKVYATTKSVFELNKELSAVEKKITELKAKWDGDIFEPPMNEKTGKPWSRGSKAYKAAKAAWESDKEGRVDKDEIAAELSLLAEKKAILQEELRWANMTQDERVEYTKKKLKQELNEEQKHNKDVIAEYRKTITEMLGIMRETDRLNKKNEGGVIDPEIQQLNARFAQLNQERIAMEENYGAIIVKVAEEANAKAVKIYAERKLTEERLRKDAEEKEWQAYLSSPEGALQLASDAKTINEMKEAQKYLQTARGNVDVKNTALIKQLNDAYTSLRITIENLTTAEKNEQSLQPTIRNEYVRLLKELEKVQAARLRLSETEAFADSDPKAESDYNALLARERDIQTKIRQIRDNSNGLLAEADNQYRADKAQRDLAETERVEKEKTDKIKARYKEVLDELRQLEKEQNRIEDLGNKYGDDFQSYNATNELYRRRQELNKERLSIERDHQDDITDIQKTENEKRVKDEVDRAERAARLSIEARKREEEKAEKDRGTYEGAMAYSGSAKSINEQIQAIKYLKIARDNLDSTSFASEDEYKNKVKEINNEIDKRKESISELTGEYEKHSAVIAQIKPLLVSVFSARAIMQYVKQLAAIRGEFEFQQRSLQVLLKSKTEANKLWSQTTALALKSPFQVKELVTATKQLAAYRVESEKLHDTTKMLADISAGLGVEMSRLILAFGQVKAANFLRGTELRQFSEAGINMLDELSAYYSKLEGEFVSVAEVFDRISKRAVSFADVEAVLKNVVYEGGTFYKMQEQQADTLKGSISNFKDSYQLMLNDIGKSTDGLMKSMVKIAKFLVDNWQSFATILKTAIPLWAAHALGVSKLGRLLRMSTESMRGTARAIELIKKGFNSAAKSVKSFFASMGPLGWFLLAFSALYAILDKVTGGFGSNVKKIETEMADLKNKFDDISVKFYVAVDKGSLEDQRLQLKRYLEALSNELSVDIKPTINIDDKDTTAEQIQEQMAEAQRVADLVTTSLSHFSIAAEKEFSRTWVSEALNEDAEDLKETSAESLHTLVEYRTKLITELKKIEKAAMNGGRAMYAAEKDMLNTLLSAEKGRDETSDEYLDRLRSIFNTLNISEKETSGKIYATLDDVKSQTKEFSKDLGEFEKELERIINQTNIPNLSEEDRKIVLEAVIETYAAEKEWGGFVTWAAKRWAEQTFYPNIDTTTVSYDSDPLAGTWKARYNEALAENTDNGAIKLSDVTKATVESTEEAVRNTLEGAITYFQTVIDVFEKTGEAGRYSVDEYNEALDKLPRAESIRDIIWGKDDNNGGSKDTRYSDLIRTVNDVYSAFDKLEEKFSDTIATEMLWRDYSEAVDTAFKKVGRSAEWVREKFGDLNTKESLKAALDWIAENATTSEAKLQAKTASAKIGVDIEIEARDEAFDELTREVEDMFSGYELSIELEKLNVPKEFAKEFFSIDSMDISELRKKVLSLKPEFEAKGALDEYKEYLDKLDAMETKEQQERLKKYLAFTRDMVSDRGKILINSARDLAEIEKAFTITNTMAFDKGLISKETKKTLDETGKTIKDLLALSDEDLTAKWGFTPEAIDNLRTYNELFEQQKNIAINASKENKDKQLKEQDWKDFQKSEVFVALFQDVDNASEKLINHMLEKLQKFRESWKDLPMEEVKEITNKIRELELALSERRPLKLFRELSDEIKDIYAGTTDIEGSKFAFTNKDALKMYGDEFDYSNAREALEIELLARQGNLQVAKEALATAEAEYDALVQQKDVTDEQLLAGQQKVANAKEEVDDNQQLVRQAQSLQGKDKQRTAALVKMTGAMQKAHKIATTLYESFSELYEALGGDNELVSIFSEMGLNMMDAVSNTILMIVQTEAATIAAHGFGAAMKSATGIIGWALLAIEMLVMALTAAFKAHDAQLQKQIEGEQERVDELKLEYEELEKQIEKAYSAGDFQRLHNEMQKNINEQITSLREMQALEEDKKKTDDKKIEGWEDEIRDLYEQLEENMKEMFSTATDGILDNVLDASRNFVDAWLDAFQETGTGIHALEDTFAEMMASILKQQAAMNIVGPYVDELTKRMKQYVNADDMVFSKEDASRIKSYWNNIQGPMNESLENFFTAFEGLLNTGSELSDLEKGIQGMTEDQAEVLAAYWNSCRFMLANIDTNVAKIASGSAIETRSSDSPLYSDLKTEMIKHTAILTTIEDLFRSVIGNESNSSHSGAYIKVLM